MKTQDIILSVVGISALTVAAISIYKSSSLKKQVISLNAGLAKTKEDLHTVVVVNTNMYEMLRMFEFRDDLTDEDMEKLKGVITNLQNLVKGK